MLVALVRASVKIVLAIRGLPQNSHLIECHRRSHPGSGHWSGTQEEYVWLRAGVHMETHDTNHGADRSVHYDTGEGSTENDRRLLRCLWSPPFQHCCQIISLLCKLYLLQCKTWYRLPSLLSPPLLLSSWVEGGKPEAMEHHDARKS